MNARPHTDGRDVDNRASSLNVESPTHAAAEPRTTGLHEPAGRPEPARPIKKVRYGRQAFDPMEMVSHFDKPTGNIVCKLLSDMPGSMLGTPYFPLQFCICTSLECLTLQ